MVAGFVAWSLATLPSCGERYEAPCRVTARTVIDPSPTKRPRVGPTSIDEGRDGAIHVVSFLEGEGLDASAPAPAEGGIGDGGIPSFVAPQAYVLVVASNGAQVSGRSFMAPARLRARGGNTAGVGASFTGDAVFFHWREGNVTSAPDGVTETSVSTIVQRVSFESGIESPPIVLPELACSRCSMQSAFATASGILAAVVSTLPDGTSREKTRRSRLVTFDADGRRASLSLDAMVTSASAAVGAGGETPVGIGGLGAQPDLSIRLTVQRGLFMVRIGRRVAFFDPKTLRTIGRDLYELPTSEAELDLDSATGNLTVVYSAAATAVGDDEPPFATGGLPDLVYEVRGASANQPIASRRISSSFTAIDLRKNDDRVGVVHTTGAGAFYFSLVEENGHKLGGDHPIAAPASASAPSSPRGSGTFDDVTSSALVVSGPNRWTYWITSGDLIREVITCDP